MSENETHETNIQEDEEPDWATLSVLPLAECASNRYISGVWKYFGQLMQGEVCVDNKNVYCAVCFDGRKLKQFSRQTSTSNMGMHLRNTHQIMIEAAVRTKVEVPKSVKRKKPKEEIMDEEFLDEYVDNSDPLDELITINRRKKYDSSFSPFKKAVTIKKEHSRLMSPYLTSSTPKPSDREAAVALKIEEAINTEDYDRLFVLSLINEFKKIHELLRLNAKSDIINLLLKYQSMPIPLQTVDVSKISDDKTDLAQLRND